MSNWNNNSVTTSSITIDCSDDYNITIPADMLSSMSTDTITITSGGNTYTTLSGISIDDHTFNYTWNDPTPFEDGFPEWNDFQEMCKEYPGLQKTYEHLKAFYNLCKDDWQAKKDGNDNDLIP